MRVILMHRTAPKWEAGERPSPELVAGMGKLIGDLASAGRLLAADGLRASSLGVRLAFQRGRRTLTPGPFVGRHELLQSFAIVRVKSLDEAVLWASRLGETLGEAEIDVRPVTEPWDIGLGQKPAGGDTTRYMLALKADADSEAGRPLRPERQAALLSHWADMRAAGLLLGVIELQPSSKGVRVVFSGARRTVVDGPFAESKELIAGFVALELPSLAEALDFAGRFAALTGDVEIDVRPLREVRDLLP